MCFLKLREMPPTRTALKAPALRTLLSSHSFSTHALHGCSAVCVGTHRLVSAPRAAACYATLQAVLRLLYIPYALRTAPISRDARGSPLCGPPRSAPRQPHTLPYSTSTLRTNLPQPTPLLQAPSTVPGPPSEKCTSTTRATHARLPTQVNTCNTDNASTHGPCTNLPWCREPAQPPLCSHSVVPGTSNAQRVWQYVHHVAIVLHVRVSLASLDCLLVLVSCLLLYHFYLVSLIPPSPTQRASSAAAVDFALPVASACAPPPQVSPTSLPSLPPSINAVPPQADSVTDTFENRPRQLAPQSFKIARTGGVLFHATYNVGGHEITPHRLCHVLAAFDPLPHISLQEFQPASSYHVRDFEGVALNWGFHLLHSSPSTKNGVALLVHSSISPKVPPLKVHIPGTLISTELRLHPNPLVPPIHVASFYRPHTIKEKRLCEPILDRLLQGSYLIMGDFNGTTHSSHATTLRPNLWPWLIAKEKAKSLVNLPLPHVQGVPFTRVRRFGGTKSYIDRAYGTRLYHNSFLTSSAHVVDFRKVHGSSNHDPLVICSILWTAPHTLEPRCALRNRRDVNLFRSLVTKHDIQAPVSSHDIESTYRTLTEVMLNAMKQVNSSKPIPPRPCVDVSDWAQVVKQLARLAKRRSKIFYRRVKHTLLSPPVPSTLPVPSTKIQRILQRKQPVEC